MPFYDYKCSRCGKVFEVLHGMSEKPKGLKCEFCSSVEVQRVFHPVGMVKVSGESDFSDLPATSSGNSCSSCSSSSCSSCR